MSKQLNQKILIELIVLSAGTQQRPLSPDVVQHYQDLRKDGVDLPPVEVIYDGRQYYLWDGFHRIAVAGKLEETHIRANVELGNERHAVFMSYHANSQHGYPRQSGATPSIIDKILEDDEWSKMTGAQIARHVGCSRQYVFERKQKLSCQVLDKTPDSQKPPSSDQGGTKRETEPNSPLRDDEGQILSPLLADRFLSRAVVKERLNELDRVKNSVMNSIGAGEMTYALVNQTGFQHDMKNARARLSTAIPYAICCYCKGKGCGSCHESGLLSEMSWKAAPKDQGE